MAAPYLADHILASDVCNVAVGRGGALVGRVFVVVVDGVAGWMCGWGSLPDPSSCARAPRAPFATAGTGRWRRLVHPHVLPVPAERKCAAEREWRSLNKPKRGFQLPYGRWSVL